MQRYMARVMAVVALMLPLALAAADETPQQQAERAAEQARIANANAQVALEAARRAQEFAEAARKEAEAAAQAVRRADSLGLNLDSMARVERRVQPISVSQVAEQMHQNADSLLLHERVLVGTDTVKLIIPERNFGRYDRGLFNFLFIPKGKWAFGLTASLGEFDTEDVQMLSFLKDFNFKGSMFSISPSVSYFVRHNVAVGMKLGYSRNKFTLGSLSVDIDDDINFSLRDVDYHTEDYSAAVFMRRYIGLDNNRRFAIYNDVELRFASGNGTFTRLYNDEPKETRTLTTKASLNFSPGVCVFIQEYVSFNISFGVFGVNYTRETQRTDGVNEGSRSGLGASFKFNLLNLNMGVAVHI
ncbi:MAG: hypothetical protein ACI4UN_06625 [Muribaculaceae bacterium]